MAQLLTPRLKGLIFDLDGTLADNLLEIFDCFRQAFLTHTGRLFSDSELFALFGPTPGEMFRAAIPDHWQDARDTYRHAYAQALVAGRFAVPGLVEALGWLTEQSVGLGVVSGGDEWEVTRTLEGLDITAYFDPTRFGDEGWDKGRNLRFVVERWGAPVERVAYVSDSPRDMEHAVGMGLVPLGAAWARAAQREALRTAGAREVFASPAALQAWLTRG